MHCYNAAFAFSNILYLHHYRPQRLSQRERYRLTVFRMSRNVRVDACYGAESLTITKEHGAISFQLSRLLATAC